MKLRSLMIVLFFLVLFGNGNKAFAQTCTIVTPTDTGSVSANVAIRANGLYKVWSRIKVPNTTNNSYYLQIDNQCPVVIGDDNTIPPDQWIWIEYKNNASPNNSTFSLTAGNHVVRIVGKEPGVRLDKILFTTNFSCQPSGFGENCTSSTSITPISPSYSPTQIPTQFLTPTSTPTQKGTSFSLNLLLHGVGKGGDNQTPGALGNFNPVYPTRPVTIYIVDQNNQLIKSQIGTIVFNPTSGDFTGTISLSQPLPLGSYIIKVATPRYLVRQIPGFITITSQNQTGVITLNQTTLTVGDSNQDNIIDSLDYNIILDCYSDILPPKACNDNLKKVSADLNDDGKVNGVDYNLFIRNLLTQIGQ